MNIFPLDIDPVIAARHNCDQHVVKICLEIAQMCSAWVQRCGIPNEHTMASFGPGYWANPITKWAGSTRANWRWMIEHAEALDAERRRRWGEHGQMESWRRLSLQPDVTRLTLIPRGELTPFPQVVGSEFRVDHPTHEASVAAYRSSYMGDKVRFARWTGSKPKWFVPSRRMADALAMYSKENIKQTNKLYEADPRHSLFDDHRRTHARLVRRFVA